jgi:methylase of polypeptide subunit release factors
MGIAASTRALAQLRRRGPAARTLDLGTGGGVLALLAAAESAAVVATDANPRAIEFARFNARWNGIAGVDWREGDLFNPVLGEEFDRILCNPPFVLSPDVEALHTDSGWPGDTLCQFIVRAAPEHLTWEGVCQVACHWAITPGEDWRKRVSAWLEGTECDAWILYSHSEPADSYAAARIAAGFRDEADAAQRLGRWRAYYSREQIEAVAFGLITLRRHRGTRHIRRYDKIADLLPSGLPPGEGLAFLQRFLQEAIRGAPRGSRSR